MHPRPPVHISCSRARLTSRSATQPQPTRSQGGAWVTRRSCGCFERGVCRPTTSRVKDPSTSAQLPSAAVGGAGAASRSRAPADAVRMPAFKSEDQQQTVPARNSCSSAATDTRACWARCALQHAHSSTQVQSNASDQGVQQPAASCRDSSMETPKLTDLVLWHGGREVQCAHSGGLPAPCQ